MKDLRTREERLRFTTEKHYLGPVCKRGHDFYGMGFSWRNYGHGNCVECTRERATSWKAENLERHAESTARRDRARTLTAHRKVRERHPFSVYMSGVRRRAKDRGIPIRLDPDDLRLLWRAQSGRCFWSGLELDFFVGTDRHPLRPSVDRLVPRLGYVSGNIVWANNFSNRARGELRAAEFAVLMRKLGFPSRVDDPLLREAP